jgi:hypothetical protein
MGISASDTYESAWSEAFGIVAAVMIEGAEAAELEAAA